MVRNTIPLMLITALALAASDLNFAQELLLLPGKESLTSFPGSSLNLLTSKSAKPKNLKMECSPQFTTNIKIAPPFADLCTNQRVGPRPIKDLLPLIGSLKMTFIGTSISDAFIRFVFSDVGKTEPDISLAYGFKVPLVIPLTLLSSEVEVIMLNESKTSQIVAEVSQNYLINSNAAEFIVETHPKDLVVGHSFEGAKLSLIFNMAALKQSAVVSFQLTDPRTGLRSSEQVLKVTPATLKISKSAISVTSQMAIMISVVSFSSVMIIAILAIFSIYSKEISGSESQDIEGAREQEAKENLPDDLQQGEERVLTDSIVIWNQNLMDKYKSRSLSTFEASYITGNDSPSSNIVYFGKFDISDDMACYAIDDDDKDFQESVYMHGFDKLSVMTNVGTRKSAFL